MAGLFDAQKAQLPPKYRPFRNGEKRANKDGSYSTEVTTTWQLPTGEWVNVPSLWMGPNGPTQFEENDEQGILGAARDYEQQQGMTFPRFASVGEAEKFAQAKSQAGGAGANMAGLFDFLGGGQAQMPGQQQMNPLQKLLDPQVALPMAQALLGNQGNMQNFGNAFGAAGQGFAQQKELQAQTAQKNKTVEFFRQQAPEYAALIDAGMPVNDAFKLYTEQRYAQPSADNRPSSILEWEYGQQNPEYWQAQQNKGRDAILTAPDKKAIFEAEDELPILDNTIASLGQAKQLNDKTYTGVGAGARGWAGTALSGMPGAGMLIDTEQARATSEFGKLMSMEAIQAMASTLKGATTDAELARFVDILADPSTPPDIRGRTIDRMMQLAERQKQIKSSRINQLRGGEYYKPGGGASGSPGGDGGGGVVDYSDYFGGQ